MKSGSIITTMGVCGLAPAFAIILAMLPSAAGQEKPIDRGQPTVVKLTLHPAAPPEPALRYRLLPAKHERKPGNAAQFYYRAILLYYQDQGRQDREKEHGEKYDRWEGKWDAATTEEVRKWVESYPRTSLGELKEAAYREECNFDYRLRDRRGIEVISFLLPEIQDMRSIGRFLRLKARLELVDGKHGDALETLRLGYQLSHDAGSEPLLINGLVGIAIASTMNAEVEHWIGSPDAPNLYWALTAMPQPLVDLSPALMQEVRLPEVMFPFIKDAETADLTPEEWLRAVTTAVDQLNSNFDPADRQKPKDPLAKLGTQLATTALIMRAYPIAKSELARSGYDAEKLEKLPVAQVVAIQMQRTVRYLGDEFAKGAYLPVRQRTEYYQNLESRLKKEGYLGASAAREPIPLASLLMPAVGAALGAQTRLDRDVAALRVLEALRAHVATTGSLPEKLSDITVLPVPVNPFTEEPFPYRREKDMAILESPPPPGQPGVIGRRYELSIAKDR